MGSALAWALSLSNGSRESIAPTTTAIEFKPKAFSIPRYLFGGSLFGIGWALTGACPGPLFTLLGNGFILYSVVILSAVLGTFVYGKLRHRLPH